MTVRIYFGSRSTRQYAIRTILNEARALGLTVRVQKHPPDVNRPFYVDFPDDETAAIFKLTWLCSN